MNSIYLILTIIVGALLYFAFIDRKSAKLAIDKILGPLSGSASKQPAAELHQVVIKMAKKRDVTWPEIFETINPTKSSSINNLLLQVRNGNQFNPFLGAAELKTGFGDALANNPNASLDDALRWAVNSGNKIKRAGD
jgi:hypothetical protein